MKVLRTVIACIVLVGMVYFISQYSGEIQEKLGVKGASTSRAEEIQGKLSSDVNEHMETAQKQAMQWTIQDIVDYFGRFGRIPQDIMGTKDYVTEQYQNMVESKDGKKE